jgi:DNA polymerase-3 subunit alpha
MIPFAVDMTLEKALQQSKDLAELVRKDERVKKLIEISRTLEGLARHCSTHAAGVVIAPTALTDYVPLFKGSRDEVTTQFDMKMVEEVGLLKMDFLGLRTLSVIDDSLRMISENYPGARVDIDNLELNDPKVYKMFAKGHTIGIFQFESAGMRDYLRRLKPENFNDITAMNALYRPGPLDSGMIDIYVECKTGVRKKEFLLPELEEILGDTYGVIVFQEQVLKIANELAGYSMGSADLLRKAMGKKDAALMAEQKREFIDGCAKNKIDEKVAGQIFEQIETFARYGFNKAHSTCYALGGGGGGGGKTYYPEEFMAGLMTSEMSNTDRIYVLLEECRRMGIEVLPPDVNESGIDFAVTNKKIRFGLQAIKNVGVGPATAIVEERQEGIRYQTLTDLASRLPARSLNRRTLESLISAGACDSLEGNRAQKYAGVEIALDFGQKVSAKKTSHDLFASSGGKITRVAPVLPDLPDWANSQKLAEEKKVLGFYVSGHPLDKYRDELKSFTSNTIADLEQVADNREITVGGIISKLSTKVDKRNKNMAFATVEDYSGQVELIIFSDTYEASRSMLEIDRMVLITGRVSTREGEAPKVIASEIVPLEKLGERFSCQLVIKIDKSKTDSTISAALASLERFSGSVPVILAAKENGSEVYIRSRKYSVNVDFELLSGLKELLGDSAAYLRPITKKSVILSNSL